MTTAQQYRVKAAEYAALAETAPSPSEVREFRTLEQNFTSLAANQEWLAGDADLATPASVKADDARTQDEQILRCLGAAVVMRWHTLPKKIRRELLDHANSIEDQQPSTELKGQIARFLPSHEDDAQRRVAHP
jgi:hypothetical protein